MQLRILWELFLIWNSLEYFLCKTAFHLWTKFLPLVSFYGLVSNIISIFNWFIEWIFDKQFYGPDCVLGLAYTSGRKRKYSVSCIFYCLCVVKVAQSYLTLCNPMDYPVHGILQARILEWIAFPFSSGSFQHSDWTQVSLIAGGFFTSWATRDTTTRQKVASYQKKKKKLYIIKARRFSILFHLLNDWDLDRIILLNTA